MRTITNPTSARFVPVRPVRICPPCFVKKDDESFSFKKRVISVMLQERAVSYIAPAYFVFPSIPSVPIDAKVKSFNEKLLQRKPKKFTGKQTISIQKVQEFLNDINKEFEVDKTVLKLV